MIANPSHFKGDPNLPVENVSWFDAIQYCNKKSLLEGLTLAYEISGSADDRTVSWNREANGYRLPTNAEWEYACRAGTTTAFNTGNNITTNQANFNEAIGRTTQVGSYHPNAWDLYDMHGNVWEWVWDWYELYESGEKVDPIGPSAGYWKVLRGGCWGRSAEYARSAERGGISPYSWNPHTGFRVARN